MENVYIEVIIDENSAQAAIDAAAQAQETANNIENYNLGLLSVTDSIPAVGRFKGDVETAGTYLNFLDAGGVALVFTQEELDVNYGYIYINEGVSTKVLSAKRNVSLAQEVDGLNTNEATTGKAVADYVDPVINALTEISENLSDNEFIIGGYRSTNGDLVTTAAVKSIPSITITAEMVGKNWINGRGILPTAYSFVIVKGISTLLINIAGTGSADDLHPISFTITPEMIGLKLLLSAGTQASEPGTGYETKFTWNIGEIPMPTYKPKSKIKDLYDKVEINQLLAGKTTEVNQDGAVVRANEVFQEVAVSGVEFGMDSGYFLYSNGVISTSLLGWKRKVFEIDGVSDYAVSGTVVSASNIAGEVFFDKDMLYLGFADRAYPNPDLVLNKKKLQYPTGTKFVGTCVRNTGQYFTMVKYVSTGVLEKAIFDTDLTVQNNRVTKINGIDIASNSNKPIITNIIAIGDSTTYGADLPNPTVDRWTTILQTRLNIPISNYGFSGARAEEITLWQGGISVDVTLASNLIPATGTRVAVNYNGEFNPFRTSTVPSFDAYLILQDGKLVAGNLNRTTGFMQLGTEPINTTNGLVRVTSKNLLDFSVSSNLMIVSFGANNTSLISSNEQTVDQVMKWYSDFAKQHPNVLVWSQNIRSAGELSICLALEDFLEKQFGTRFCNMRKYLASNRALKDAAVVDPAFVETEADAVAVASGLIPPSFKFVSNSAHLNVIGHKLQANYLYSHIKLYFN